MSASALLRAAVLLVIGLFFLYAGIFNPHMMNEGATSQPAVSEGTSRLIDLAVGVGGVLFSLWVIRRQLRAAPQPLAFGTQGKALLMLAGVAGLAAVGYAVWYNAHQTYVPPTRHEQPASPATAADAAAGPAPAPAPLPPAGTAGDEPAEAPGPLPAAVPQAGGPASAPAPLPPTGE
ncbi:hypothetical protein [Hymenobacter psoromatis]|uniref:hypothetical protein n=1 Tax=Hymenobacter psoromatis TaxID=1484116 RepID=UPI001CBC3802|nr:hypothetical protein [Hymenobacter psoromatis]